MKGYSVTFNTAGLQDQDCVELLVGATNEQQAIKVAESLLGFSGADYNGVIVGEV